MSPSGPRSVIIADNSQLHRQAIGDLYREMGFEVRLASDGIEALGLVADRRPDLLVLDLIMPRIDGAQVCAWIRDREQYANIPVIILSGILSDEIEDLERINADAFIAKMPLSQIADEIRTVSMALLGGGEAERPILQGFEKMYRREVVQELLLERRTRRAIMDSLSEGIVELSEDRRLLKTNRAFDAIAGRPASELLSMRLEDVFPDGGPCLRGLAATLARGAGVAAGALEHNGRNLQMKLHRVNGAAGSGGGAALEGDRPVGFTLLVEDITQRTLVEKDRERLQARLTHTEKMSAIGGFVAGAAHEINNPLTSVLGYAQLLRARIRDDAVSRELESIIEGATRCKTIVEKLMTFARTIRSEKSPTDLNALVIESVSAHRERLQQLGAEVTLDLAADLAEVSANPHQITRAFEHILDNAVKALGEVNGARRLTVATGLRDGRAVIRFSDTGPGIPAHRIGRVFEPFFTTRQVGQGAGLGLSVSYGIVADHGGRLAAENGADGGAVLTIDLPATAPRGRGGEGGATEDAGPASREQRRVLLVEDHAAVVRELADILENFDHEVETVCGGVAGLQKIQEGDYDLIILDVTLPDMTPERIYDELCRNCPEALDRIVFMAASDAGDDTRRFFEQQGHRWLPRPFSVQGIVETVRAVLGEGPPD